MKCSENKNAYSDRMNDRYGNKDKGVNDQKGLDCVQKNNLEGTVVTVQLTCSQQYTISCSEL